ncbi:Glucoamylase 1 precursor [Spathaspora passalidarum NRRL Y-27907]|uniref:Glucoamylase 1 n=1 Tax=Spathaspora passalidarum (strain NRRL Y-27907 / 11-Y1) TaxID=619300 RepID=G3AQ23_SPAPN|nr:Glucoamylase 1 precursor [Spathaspora passalidarum NRRL Y-27907]EGW32344.1 Glucoamylase 1 precursor [Spathaspora passalidarum NRRL Y-27907]
MILSSVVKTAIALAMLGYSAASPTPSSSSVADSHPTVPNELTLGVKQVPNILNETAVDANQVAKGYSLTNVTATPRGLTGLLNLKGATNIYGYDFDKLNLTVTYQSDNRLNVRIAPVNLTDVYILPESLVALPKVEGDVNTFEFENSDLIFSYDSENFGFEVKRASTAEVLFSTKGNPLVFSNQFVQFNTTLPKGHQITGLGESIHGSLNEPGTVKTLFANDVGDPIDGNIYGVHPVYYDQRYDTGTTHGVYWRTSAIQEVVVEDQSLTWRALSGVIDLYFFSGPDPKDVIQQYVKEIGLPAMQPYWALGYHQCRWGYDTIDDVKNVVENFKKFNIPLETIWTDIDYMDTYKDFTNDPYRYPTDKYQQLLEELHSNNQHYVPIFDAAIYVPNPNNATDNAYTPFHAGNESDIFLKNPDGSLYIGAVWPGYTAFPDFLNNKTQEYWNEQFKTWHDRIPFDGIWTDMNEVSSFCVGSCGSGRYFDNPVHPPFAVGAPATSYPLNFNVTNATEWASISSAIAATASTPVPEATSSSSSSIDSKNTLAPGKGNINYPPYAINNAQGDHDLATHAVSPNATHVDGTVEYDIHNLYGFTQEKAIYNALLNIAPDKRPFIIGRSTFAGAGHYVGHWGGDNSADYDMMYFSIPQAFSMGLSGVPFFGVDVCGFNGNTDMELCSRWMQLGSFFPFYRNHNVLGAISQEPYVWESVTEAAKTSMNIRYLLLPYYYTLLHESHTSGLPILRSFNWEFPYDKKLSGIDNQFFVGDALVVTPVLQPGVDKVKGVFPGTDEVYYDFYTTEKQNFKNDKNETLDAPLGHIPLHIRGGHILPTQEPGYTTTESRKNPFGLLVALDKDGKAAGKLYLDDGESLNVTESLYVDFVAGDNELSVSAFGDYKVEQPLANVTILGVDKKPEGVKFGDSKVNYKYEKGTVYITGLEKYTKEGAFAEEFTVSW